MRVSPILLWMTQSFKARKKQRDLNHLLLSKLCAFNQKVRRLILRNIRIPLIKSFRIRLVLIISMVALAMIKGSISKINKEWA